MEISTIYTSSINEITDMIFDWLKKNVEGLSTKPLKTKGRTGMPEET
jgi:hypothetical protein